VTTIATTRIIAVHQNRGKSVAECLSDRTDYAKNPDKTNNSELISAYECDSHTADAEFLLSKRQYELITGRKQKNNVIAYQIRQSFKPGEVTPEQANEIGYELAMRFLKGKHAFIVCTHVDKKHIHSHIIFNSTALDCSRKFRDFLGSGRAVARLSDIICLEHGLSVIKNPKRYTHSTYDKWLGSNAKVPNREIVRAVIDDILSKKPTDFDNFLVQLEKAGYTVKRGKHITISHPTFKKNIRMKSLGDGYTEEDIRAVIHGAKSHKPTKRRSILDAPKNTLLIDIEAKLREGKGRGYEQWAKVYNLKQMARTRIYLQEHGLLDYSDLAKKAEEATARFDELSDKIKNAEKRMTVISVLKSHIINYAKTRKTYIAYRKAGYSKKFLADHESDILLHKAAKKAFDELGIKKLPTVKSLQTEYAQLLLEKKSAYAEYYSVRSEMRELLLHKSNVEQILGKEPANDEKKKEHNRS